MRSASSRSARSVGRARSASSSSCSDERQVALGDEQRFADQIQGALDRRRRRLLGARAAHSVARRCHPRGARRLRPSGDRARAPGRRSSRVRAAFDSDSSSSSPWRSAASSQQKRGARRRTKLIGERDQKIASLTRDGGAERSQCRFIGRVELQHAAVHHRCRAVLTGQFVHEGRGHAVVALCLRVIRAYGQSPSAIATRPLARAALANSSVSKRESGLIACVLSNASAWARR